MTWADVVLYIWTAGALFGWLSIAVMLVTTYRDWRAAQEYVRDHPTTRARYGIGLSYLRLAFGLFVVQTAFLLTAIGAALDVEPAILRGILTFGSLAPGVSAALWYRDRRAWERHNRPAAGLPPF